MNYQYLHNCVEQQINRARSILGNVLPVCPTISIVPYITQNHWARANSRSNTLVFAYKALELDRQALEGLINHELAHLIVKHGRHDDSWLKVCNQLGGNTETEIEE